MNASLNPVQRECRPAGLKIAQVATTGLSIRVLLLPQIQALANAGHRVTAICAPSAEAERVRGLGIRVITVPMSRRLNPLRDLRSLGALTECFRREAFDVVHSHTPKAGLLSPLAARRARVPAIVHTIHGLLFHDRQPFWQRRLLRAPEFVTARASHHLLSQSRQDIEVALRAGLCAAEKIEYLGNGIDVQNFSSPTPGRRLQARERFGIASNDFVIGAAGRLVRAKGFAELFAAAEIVKSRRTDARFLVIAAEDSESRDALSGLRLRQAAARHPIRFLPWQEEMAEYYAALDAFALPSHREGVPRAAMEASACGLPVIATDIRGCREVVEHARTGLLVPVRDAQALAAAMEELLADRNRARAYGENGRRRALESFDQRQVLARLLAFYERLSHVRLGVKSAAPVAAGAGLLS